MESQAILPVDRWLEHLELHIRRFRASENPESVHQLRVAAGRLSVWLELAGRRALRDDLCWLRRSAATVRDLDVMLAKGRSPQWNDLLSVDREAALETLRATLATSRAASVSAGLSCVPAPTLEAARAGLRRIRRRVLSAGDRLGDDECDPDVLHHLRRKIRRLRYALEWLGDDVTEIKAVQDTFGAMNDMAVESKYIEAHDTGAALDAHRRTVEAEYDRLRLESIAAWQRARPLIGDRARGR
jgi:CHAD domain-containing protein